VFFDFPAEHWKHLQTTNPIESTFATVRHRTSRSKAACRTRRRLPWSSSLSKAHRKIADQLQKLIHGIRFTDGRSSLPRIKPKPPPDPQAATKFRLSQAQLSAAI
jgi:putative transposase